MQRVVYTSSTGAVFTPGAPTPTTWTENDWNDKVVEIVREQGKKAERHILYLASKVLAEQGTIFWLFSMISYLNETPAAWEFYEKHKDVISWDFSVVCAPWVSFDSF